jgi:hypothetical protein
VRLESGVGPLATSTENDSLQRRPMCLPHARPTHVPPTHARGTLGPVRRRRRRPVGAPPEQKRARGQLRKNLEARSQPGPGPPEMLARRGVRLQIFCPRIPRRQLLHDPRGRESNPHGHTSALVFLRRLGMGHLQDLFSSSWSLATPADLTQSKRTLRLVINGGRIDLFAKKQVENIL